MSSNGNGQEGRTPEAWDVEGEVKNIIAPGINLYYYKDLAHGILHYVLVMLGMTPTEDSYRMDRQFHFNRDEDAKLVLDGAKQEWERASRARDAGDEFGALAHTYRGLRLIFPDLPEDITTVRRGQG